MNMRHYNPLTEPDREFVERAIVEVLKVAQRQGITAANFLQMLDSGMRISDFLNAMNVSANVDHTTDCNCS